MTAARWNSGTGTSPVGGAPGAITPGRVPGLPPIHPNECSGSWAPSREASRSGRCCRYPSKRWSSTPAAPETLCGEASHNDSPGRTGRQDERGHQGVVRGVFGTVACRLCVSYSALRDTPPLQTFDFSSNHGRMIASEVTARGVHHGSTGRSGNVRERRGASVPVAGLEPEQLLYFARAKRFPVQQ